MKVDGPPRGGREGPDPSFAGDVQDSTRDVDQSTQPCGCPNKLVLMRHVATLTLRAEPLPSIDSVSDSRGRGEQSAPEQRARSRFQGFRHPVALPHGREPHPSR